MAVPQTPQVTEQTAAVLEQQVRILVREDIAALALGLVILVIGLSAVAIHLLRSPKSGGRFLLWFGLFAGIYGLRGLADARTVALVMDVPREYCLSVVRFANYLILIPCMLFLEEFYGKGWRSSVRWLLWIFSGYAVLAVVAGSALRDPGALPDPATGFLVLLPAVFIVGHILGYRPPKAAEAGALITGASIFILTVINEHLVEARLVPWGLQIEPMGFLAFIGCLGYAAARRFISNERQLLAIDEEMKSASRIQAAILPPEIPRTRGLRIAVRYLPMAAVAGDFYGFLEAGSNRLGILVADVTGHGVPAALVASMIKVGISAQAANASNPARVISSLNTIFCREVQGQLCTACYLFLDAESRKGFYSAAGHPPLLLRRRDEKGVLEFNENGLVLGVRASEEYATSRFELRPGDRILMYTDGIIEAAGPSEDLFGTERLKEFLATRAHLGTDPFADALLEEVSLFSGGKTRAALTDDLTLVVVDIAEESEIPLTAPNLA